VVDGGPANALQDKVMITRWDSLVTLPPDDRDRIIFVLDSLIREAQTRKAFRNPADQG